MELDSEQLRSVTTQYQYCSNTDIIPLRIIFYNYNVISMNKFYFWF